MRPPSRGHDAPHASGGYGQTNDKDYDPKREYRDPENDKGRGGNYEGGLDFDPGDGDTERPDENEYPPEDERG